MIEYKMNRSYKIVKSNSVEYIISPLLDKTGMVRHFFSTKNGGSSSGAYRSMNLGVYTDDKKENIDKNMDIIFSTSGMKVSKLVYLKQVHGSKVHIVDSVNADMIKGLEGDAIITSSKNIPVGVFTADCVPILMLDQNKGVIAAVHAGWKGTSKKISCSVIDCMISNFGSDPSDIIAVIGPSIGSCCFEVGEDTANFFSFKEKKNESYYVDLWAENINQIKSCKVPEKNIELTGLCSKCRTDMFYSYRRDNGNTGRMGSFIELI